MHGYVLICPGPRRFSRTGYRTQRPESPALLAHLSSVRQPKTLTLLASAPLSRALPEVLRLLSAYGGAPELQRGHDILLTGLTTILTRQAKPGRPRQHGTPPADPPLPVARP